LSQIRFFYWITAHLAWPRRRPCSAIFAVFTDVFYATVDHDLVWGALRREADRRSLNARGFHPWFRLRRRPSHGSDAGSSILKPGIC
jgi:hypothetical protein